MLRGPYLVLPGVGPAGHLRIVNRDRSIDAYRQKRDFERTPEPAPADPHTPAAETEFVVHRHEARRLHYDLRLRSGNVLKCFAIPKGFSYIPEDKFLAVRTEDHPLEYVEFRGRIPKGEYGGGTMLIWDRGTYVVLKAASVEEAIALGELKLVLRGRRLRGEWHLVRTSQEKEQWLLFKSRDVYARTREEGPAPLPPDSAPSAPIESHPRFMKPGKEREPFDDPDWGFEVEFTGRRVFACKDGTTTALLGLEQQPALARILASLAGLHAERALVDGVLTVSEASAESAGALLPERLAEGNAAGLVYYATDILHCDDWDLRAVAYHERKQLLSALIRPDGAILCTDPVIGRGAALADAAHAAGVRGLIAKKLTSPYQAGEHSDWIHIAVPAAGGAHGALKAAAVESHPDASGGARHFALRNLDKVYWVRDGITKGDLIAYYATCAEVLLPYLRDRPVHLLRYPDGIDGKSFYQKQVMDYVPDWIRTVFVGHDEAGEEVRYIVCDNQETLLYLINLGSIDLHPWMSRTGSMDSPDWAFIDLDPKEAPFSHVLRLARQTGRLLRGIGVSPFVKTSGKTGIHIAIPLQAGYTYDQSRIFCESIARVLVRENKEIATVERNPKSRGGRVYVDFLQNRREQTIVPPYVVRPVEGARVSMPLEWDELEADLDPGAFCLRTAPERIRKLGDLFRPALEQGHDLIAAVTQLEEYLRTGG